MITLLNRNSEFFSTMHFSCQEEAAIVRRDAYNWKDFYFTCKNNTSEPYLVGTWFSRFYFARVRLRNANLIVRRYYSKSVEFHKVKHTSHYMCRNNVFSFFFSLVDTSNHFIGRHAKNRNWGIALDQGGCKFNTIIINII